MRIKKNKTVKRIFIFFLCYLVFQYVLVGIVGVLYSEPWPAFVLPGFKNIYATQDKVEITEPTIFALTSDSTRQPIDAFNLFKGLPTSQMSGFLRSNFNSKADYSPEAKNWLEQRLKHLYPDKNLTGLQVEWVQVTYKQENNVQSDSRKNSQITIPFR